MNGAEKSPWLEALTNASKVAAEAAEAAAAASGGGATTPPRGMEVHSLGSCSHNHDFSQGMPFPPRNFYHEHFYNYRFVIVMENTLEMGYVTEKLGGPLAAGAVPIYWGDSEAAAKVFNPASYIDSQTILRDAGRPADAYSVFDYQYVADFVIGVDADRSKYEEYMYDNVLPPKAGRRKPRDQT